MFEKKLTGTFWQHNIRGSKVEIIAVGELQLATPAIREGDILVAYQEQSDKRIWLRKQDEFLDGRFTEISSWKAFKLIEAYAIAIVLGLILFMFSFNYAIFHYFHFSIGLISIAITAIFMGFLGYFFESRER